MFLKKDRPNVLISAYVPFAMVELVFPCINAKTVEEAYDEAKLFIGVALQKPENCRIKAVLNPDGYILREF